MTAKKNDSTDQPVTPEAQANLGTVNLSDLGKAMGDAVAQGIAAGTRRRLTFGEYLARGGNSPFHPDPNKKIKMNREYYNNGRLVEFSTVKDVEIELLNQITHSGRYINRLVEVIVQQNGSEEAVNIVFSNKSQFAFELKGLARDFEDMLRQIVAAQKIEREEAEDEKADRAERRRQFGQGRATRDAVAAAGK